MRLPPQPVIPRGRVRTVMRRLSQAIDGLEEPAVEKIAADQQQDPFQVLIATMLSAQTKDAVTHAASTRLFRVARTPRTLARLAVKQIERLIYPVSFYRNKAVHVQKTCEQILSRYAGVVPDSMEELLTLPGVGRKTANLVLILAHRSPDNICVDTHVHRISNRLGWVRTRTPEETERALYAATHRQWWPVINLYLVTWGQNVCRPVYPLCGSCVLFDVCPKIGVTRVGRSRAAATEAQDKHHGRAQKNATKEHGKTLNTEGRVHDHSSDGDLQSRVFRAGLYPARSDVARRGSGHCS